MHFLILTATHQDYRALKSVVWELLAHKQHLTTVAITGVHLMDEQGGLKKFKEDEIPIALKLDNITAGQNSVEALKTAFLIPQLAGFFAFNKPDALVVAHASVEAFAAASTAFLSNIPVVHVSGGEHTADAFTNNIRFAISRLTHLHFVATKEARNRLKATGEPSERIHLVGAPEIDALLRETIAAPSVLEEKYKLKQDSYFLLIQHPEPCKAKLASRHITQILAALREFETPVVALEPQIEPGSQTITRAIKSEASKLAHFAVYKNLPRDEFLMLLRNCRALIGNSSLGIVEAASFGRPVINIGERQRGREHASNVIDVAIKAKEIAEAIGKINDKFVKRAQSVKNIYGDGKAGKKIYEILNSTKFDDALLNKQLNL